MELDKEELEATRNRKGCGIEKLEEHRIISIDGSWIGMELPTKREIMNKINEIIREVNKIR